MALLQLPMLPSTSQPAQHQSPPYTAAICRTCWQYGARPQVVRARLQGGTCLLRGLYRHTQDAGGACGGYGTRQG